MSLEPGMKFCSTTVGAGADWKSKMLAWSIRQFEIRKSKDRHAFYTHSGIIANEDGTTYEARWHYGLYRIDDYIGSPILIGRTIGMDAVSFNNGMAFYYDGKHCLFNIIGRRYPIRVLALMAMPQWAYFRPTGMPVCSECAAIHDMGCGIGDLKTMIGEWKNQTPDDIADMIHKWDAYEVVFEGVWPGLKVHNNTELTVTEAK